MTQELPKIDIRSTALLLMDLQEGILANYSGGAMLVSKAQEILKEARKRKITVGFVRVGFEEVDYRKVPDRNKAFSGIVTPKRFPSEAPDTQIVSEISPIEGEIVVRKVRHGAMSTTNLHEQLQERGIDTLVLTGIATSGVVLSTLRDAADKDYRLFVIEDLCLDGDPQVHEVLMGKVFPRQAWVINSTDFLALI